MREEYIDIFKYLQIPTDPADSGFYIHKDNLAKIVKEVFGVDLPKEKTTTEDV